MGASGRSIVVTVAVLAGCGGDAGPDHTVVDSFDDCHRGLHFAECGDEPGEPVFGCDSEYGCWWFTRGAVPAEVSTVSSCPPDDICCHGDWPFDPPEGDSGAYELFYGLGTLPWDREREMHLEVVVDPALPTPAASTLACTGEVLTAPGVGPCGNVDGAVVYELDTPAIAVFAPGDYYGWSLLVEIDEAPGGDLRARACVDRYTDVIPTECPDAAVSCASEGTVTLPAWPLPPGTTMPFRVDVALPDGSTLVADGVITTD
jgi:hypothetical protein